MPWGNTAYCVKLHASGEDLSRSSNKIESVGLRKCPCHITNISQSAQHITAENQLAWILYEEITSLSLYVSKRSWVYI